MSGMLSPSGIVTFTTDFGLTDPFAGEMKGAALAVHRDLVLVDLTHDVPAHDVEAGAYALETGYGSFPEGTVHVAVVDPGVGTDRRAIAVETDRFWFVAPDNGTLWRALRREQVRAVHALENPRYRPAAVSSTFHGRDIFAPAAAWLVTGVGIEQLGPPVPEPEGLDRTFESHREGDVVMARVLAVDRFGNIIVDLHRESLPPAGEDGERSWTVTVRAGVWSTRCLVSTYGDASPTELFALFNSSGYLEVAYRERSAAKELGLEPGDRLTVSIVPLRGR